jgi:hypothetical protein
MQTTAQFLALHVSPCSALFQVAPVNRLVMILLLELRPM